MKKLSFVLIAVLGAIVLIGCPASATPDPSSTNGVLDSTFGIGGFVVDDGAAGGDPLGGPYNDYGYSIGLDSEGNIYVAGNSSNGTNTDMIVWKYNSDGIPDSGFGTNGIVVSQGAAGGDGGDGGSSITFDSDDNIYVTGSSYNGTDTDMVVWKYNSSGVLDTSFSGDGIVSNNNAAGGAAGTDSGAGIVLDSAGYICVTGRSYNGSNFDMATWKYSTGGLLYSDFNLSGNMSPGSSGIVISDNAAGGWLGDDQGNAIASDSNGNIYVAGQSKNEGYFDMVIWKYKSNGALDTNFGVDGIVVHNNAAGGDGNDYGYALALDSDGNIYVTGRSHNGYNFDTVIWKYNSSGSLDTSFDNDGLLVYPSGGAGEAIAVDSEGNIYVSGIIWYGTNADMIIWKYKSNGLPDTAFGNNGIVTHNNAAGGIEGHIYDFGFSIALDSADQIYVAGYGDSGSSATGENYDMVIWKYH